MASFLQDASVATSAEAQAAINQARGVGFKAQLAGAAAIAVPGVAAGG